MDLPYANRLSNDCVEVGLSGSLVTMMKWNRQVSWRVKIRGITTIIRQSNWCICTRSSTTHLAKEKVTSNTDGNWRAWIEEVDDGILEGFNDYNCASPLPMLRLLRFWGLPLLLQKGLGDEKTREVKVWCWLNRGFEGFHFILKCFKKLSGLSINFSKSVLLPINVDGDVTASLASTIGCSIGEFPCKHLGLPLVKDRLRKADWLALVDKVSTRLSGWKSWLVSMGSKVSLLQAVLSNLPTFYLSIFKMPKGIGYLIDVIHHRFLWNGTDSATQRPHLVNWEAVCLRRTVGGLGILILPVFNKSLRSKWLWRWETAPHAVWRKLLWERYGHRARGHDHTPLPSCQMTQVAKGIFGLAVEFSPTVTWALGDGNLANFWEDICLRVVVPDRSHCAALLWKLTIPAKVKGRLLTRAYQASWQPNDPDLCVLCNAERETTTHLLCSCAFTAQLWDRLRGEEGMRADINSLDDLWEVGLMLHQAAVNEVGAGVALTVISALLWSLWRTRKAKIFSDRADQVDTVWEDTISLTNSWGGGLAGARSFVFRGGRLRVS
ncbi:putative ribonuclease H protein [Acorus calamus]|uniref:Ribonuclease H protein n=1 Tax=Acorus calamus TaxID=4465 RepID=A0AAV9CIP9_ACOCL|nr:putative ribonuclease H protein [Acorus calamus]